MLGSALHLLARRANLTRRGRKFRESAREVKRYRTRKQCAAAVTVAKWMSTVSFMFLAWLPATGTEVAPQRVMANWREGGPPTWLVVVGGW